MAKTKTYDPKLIKSAFGPVIMSGFAEGTFIAISQNGDAFEKVRGADGSVDRVNKNANDYSITFTLKRTSLTNDALSTIHNLDKRLNNGINPFVLKDLNGTTVFAAQQAWIAKQPDPEESDSMPTREWRIDTGEAECFIGGNIL